MSSNTQWVIAPPKKSVIVGVAEMVVCNDVGADLVTHSLGSCLGIAVYDPVRKIGGLLHVMLPDSKIHPTKAASTPAMFIDSGVPRLFHALYDLGAERSRLTVRAAGGAQFLDPGGIFNIGQRNEQALAQLLQRNGFVLQGKSFGGVASRTMRLELATGKVQLHSPGQAPYYI